jgi:hypothetical protein
MERPQTQTQTRFACVLGLGALITMGGCQGAFHRRGIPPEPPIRDGNAVGFGSDPKPSQTGPLTPTGPVSRGGGVAAPGSLYGTGDPAPAGVMTPPGEEAPSPVGNPAPAQGQMGQPAAAPGGAF